MNTPILRRIPDVASAAWIILVVTRFLGAYFGWTEVAVFEEYGLHVLLLGLCLALAAINGALVTVRRV